MVDGVQKAERDLDSGYKTRPTLSTDIHCIVHVHVYFHIIFVCYVHYTVDHKINYVMLSTNNII